MKKNVFVTGGSGFLGSHVADILTSKGYNVIIYDKKIKMVKKKTKIYPRDISNLKIKKNQR